MSWVSGLPAGFHDGATPASKALFIQAKGELALAISSKGRIHVPNFLKAADTPGGIEQGELRLEYPRPRTERDIALQSLGNSFRDGGEPISANHAEPGWVLIQTLTSAKAAPAALAPGSIFVAHLQRAADGGLSIASLIEVAPAQSAVVTGFSGSNRLTLQLAEAPNGLRVDVHPELTIVEIGEPALPGDRTQPPATSDSGEITVGAGSDANNGGSSGSFIRGPWAQQGLRVQVGDICTVELGPAPRIRTFASG